MICKVVWGFSEPHSHYENVYNTILNQLVFNFSQCLLDTQVLCPTQPLNIRCLPMNEETNIFSALGNALKTKLMKRGDRSEGPKDDQE